MMRRIGLLLTVEGVRLIDWITELVGGSAPGDVHCVDCSG